MNTGNSDTPLAKKLNLRDGQVCWFDAMPEHIIDEIDEYALELRFVADPWRGIDAAHIFVTEAADLAEKLASLRSLIAMDGQVWVSWPTETQGDESVLDQDTVKSAGLSAGFLDTKTLALDEVWSGMKFVIPKAHR